MIENIYYDPEHPAGFSSSNKISKYVSKNYNKQKIDKWLASQDSYTLHKQIRKKFKRNRYHVTNINDLFEADLIDLQSIKTYNDNYNYLLTVIDVFSKYAWVKVLYRKTGDQVASAFEEIFKEHKYPLFVRTDKGGEFTAKPVQKMFKKYGIKHLLAKDPNIKAGVIERFNRTLKSKMFKYFTFTNNYRYIDDIQKFVNAYNNTDHRTIKMPPANVNDDNILEVYNNTYQNADEKLPKYFENNNIYKVGDYVRISRFKHVFEKSYLTNWTDEIFKIIEVIKRIPVVYRISDLADEPIDGVFYHPEIQKIVFSTDDLVKINEILKRRTKNGIKELYVSWKGYPVKFNSWIAESNIKTL